jgi:HEPN domain-containing protein
MRPETKNWLASAEYDFETAKHMLSSQRYIYVVFLCHLAVEKMLKAIASEVHSKSPPRTHDLIFLNRYAEVIFEPGHYEIVSKLNNASVPTRYPSDMKNILSEYTEEVANTYLKQTEEVIKWLKSHQRLKE